jgi:hypothetical protein
MRSFTSPAVVDSSRAGFGCAGWCGSRKKNGSECSVQGRLMVVYDEAGELQDGDDSAR